MTVWGILNAKAKPVFPELRSPKSQTEPSVLIPRASELSSRDPLSPEPQSPAYVVATASTCFPGDSTARHPCPWHRSLGGAAHTCPRTSRYPASGLWRGGTVGGHKTTGDPSRGTDCSRQRSLGGIGRREVTSKIQCSLKE